MSKEQISTQNQSDLVPFKKSREDAERLFIKYHDQIAEASTKPFDEGVSPFKPNEAIEFFLEKFPDEVLNEFVGHGMSKRGSTDILGAFLNALANHTIRGDTGRLKHGAKPTYLLAYTHSPFLILSRYRKDLASLDQNGKARRNAIGLVIEPGAFVVNNEFYPIVDEIRAMYPDAPILKANEIPAYIKSQLANETT